MKKSFLNLFAVVALVTLTFASCQKAKDTVSDAADATTDAVSDAADTVDSTATAVVDSTAAAAGAVADSTGAAVEEAVN